MLIELIEMRVDLVTVVIGLALMEGSDQSGTMEYCLTESFLAQCSEGEMIVMDRAIFGRMDLGRCVTRNYGYLGCSVDVLNQLDYACSGRQSCELSVSDPSLVRTKPCPSDFSSYLEATFHCVEVIPVTSSSDESCTENRHRTMKVKQGYLAGNFQGIPAGNNPGIPTISDQPCILVFNVPAGQKLNMTLFDFTQRMTSSVSLFDESAGSHQFAHEHQGQMCRQYAVVREPATGFSVSICGGSHREKHAYLSRSNLVHLQMSSWNHVTTDDAFQPIRYMIKFEVVGCTDLHPPPDGARIKYEHNRLIISCNHSRIFSVFLCVDGVWQGELHNCSVAPKPNVNAKQPEAAKDINLLPPTGVSVLIIVGVALVIVVYISIAILFVICVRWRKRRDSMMVEQSKDRKCAVGTLVQSRYTSNVNTIASNNKRFVQHESHTMRGSTPNLVMESGGSLTDTDCPACNRDLVLLKGYPSNNRLLQDLAGARLELTSNTGLQETTDYKTSFHKTRILLNNL